MIISEMASRDINNVATEPAHHSVHSHIDNTSLHTAAVQNRCLGRYFSFLIILEIWYMGGGTA